jgi:hypothetical protein
MKYLAIVLVVFLAACEQREPPRRLFSVGDMVCMKLDGRRAQVLYNWAHDSYMVRVPVTQNVLNGSTQSYNEIYAREFELERCR